MDIPRQQQIQIPTEGEDKENYLQNGQPPRFSRDLPHNTWQTLDIEDTYSDDSSPHYTDPDLEETADVESISSYDSYPESYQESSSPYYSSDESEETQEVEEENPTRKREGENNEEGPSSKKSLSRVRTPSPSPG